MRRLGLGICPRWKTTTIIDHADAYPVDAAHLKRRSGYRCSESHLERILLKHCHRRSQPPLVISWAIADHMRTDLIQDALQMALVLHGERPASVIFHWTAGQ
jgi:hypothetical protein